MLLQYGDIDSTAADGTQVQRGDCASQENDKISKFLKTNCKTEPLNFYRYPISIYLYLNLDGKKLNP